VEPEGLLPYSQNPQLEAILSQFNPIHTFISYFSTGQSHIICYLGLNKPSDVPNPCLEEEDKPSDFFA